MSSRPRRVLAFAHRGGLDSGGRHNSAEAFADALGRGCDLETDVRLSRDGVPVLVHDAVWWRAPWLVVTGWWSARGLARLGVMTLEALLAELPDDRHLSLDLKVPGRPSAVLEVVRRSGAARRTWLVHSDLAVLAELRRLDTEVRLVHEAPLSAVRRLGRTPEQHLAALAALRVDAQNTRWSGWTPELVAQAHGQGVLAFGSIAQTTPDLQTALSTGLDGIYSDNVELMAAAVRSAR